MGFPDMKYKDWVPVTDENRLLVEEEQSIGHMRIIPHEEEDGTWQEYARFTPRGYRLAKRADIMRRGGILKFIYNYLNCIDFYLSLGDRIFVRDLKD